ncbi:MAG: hypothetical protein E7338_00100 [Clostridiales bacterium]|nr:hypothetical protein [Clostridiales bacterium]
MIKKLAKRRIRKFWNVKIATNPGRVVLNIIIVFNLLLFIISSLVLRSLEVPGSEGMSYPQATFYVIRLILSNNMDYEMAGPHVVGIGIFTIVVMFLGTIFFTGSLIAYLTNFISTYMSYRNPALKKLYLYNHIVILGWNVRAPEIIRNFLFTGKKQEILILANEDRDVIQDAIDECLADAIYSRNTKLKQKYAKYGLFKRIYLYAKNKLRNRLVIMIKQGDTYSSQQLKGVSLNLADAVIILGEDLNNNIPEDSNGGLYDEAYGNSQIIKTVAQVAHITSSEDSINNQNIIVEVDDTVTLDLVSKIIKDQKQLEKCRIIPMPVTHTMGSLISQFALNPEMGPIYSELLSQYGLTISVKETDEEDTIEYTRNYLKTHKVSLPLSSTKVGDKNYGFYIGEVGDEEIPSQYEYKPKDIKITDCIRTEFNDVIFFGHNTQFKQVLKSIDATVGLKKGRNNILIIDSKRSIPANFTLKNCDIQEVYTTSNDPTKIYEAFVNFLKNAKHDVTLVLLSNNEKSIDHADDETIASLVRVRELQSIILKNNPEINIKNIKVVVEILDPKHHDIVKSFNVHNVIISNRLTSKMITQFAFESTLFDLYLDMLVKSEDLSQQKRMDINSDMYTLKATECFKEIPQDITAFDLIRSVFEASIKDGKYVIVIGVIDENGVITLFDKNQKEIKPKITKDTKLILYHR